MGGYVEKAGPNLMAPLSGRQSYQQAGKQFWFVFCSEGDKGNIFKYCVGFDLTLCSDTIGEQTCILFLSLFGFNKTDESQWLWVPVW